MPASKKIGLLGGSFDPIHNGHVHIAEQVLNQSALDEIWFIPNNQSPQRKRPHFSAKDRYTMCELALKNLPAFKLCDIEINNQKNYTIDTIKKLKTQHPDDEFYLILGMDAYLHFETWRNWQEILNQVNLIVVNRPGFTATKKKPKAEFINMLPLDISASAIRKNPEAHQTDLPVVVWEYLKNQLKEEC